jgi:hypothetical protein
VNTNTHANAEPIALHQTVIVPPSRLPPLFLLAVPKSEVATEDERVCETVADLLESTGSPMTLERWGGILRRLEPEWHELAHWWEEAWDFWPPFRHLRHHLEYRGWFRREIHELTFRLRAYAESPQFARGLLEGLLSGPDLPLQPRPLARGPFPWAYWLSPVSVLAEVLYANQRRLELSEGEAASWAFITGVLAADKSPRVRATLESVSDFDVPFALSRRSDKTPLSSILSEARMVAFFPMVPGAVLAAHQISQANYVVAFEVAASSGAITLILAATYSLAEHLLRLGRRRRRSRQ